MFGRELFTPFTNPAHQAMNAFLLIVEGEFNVLQLQSLTVRYAEAIGSPPTGAITMPVLWGASRWRTWTLSSDSPSIR